MQGKNDNEQGDELFAMEALNSLDPKEIRRVLMHSETFKNYREGEKERLINSIRHDNRKRKIIDHFIRQIKVS